MSRESKRKAKKRKKGKYINLKPLPPAFLLTNKLHVTAEPRQVTS